MYMVTSFAFMIVGLMTLLIRAESAAPGLQGGDCGTGLPETARRHRARRAQAVAHG